MIRNVLRKLGLAGLGLGVATKEKIETKGKYFIEKGKKNEKKVRAEFSRLKPSKDMLKRRAKLAGEEAIELSRKSLELLERELKKLEQEVKKGKNRVKAKIRKKRI